MRENKHRSGEKGGAMPRGDASRIDGLRRRKWQIHGDAVMPNGEAVLAALRAGVLEHGAPARICIDNGKDYRSRAVAGGSAAADR